MYLVLTTSCTHTVIRYVFSWNSFYLLSTLFYAYSFPQVERWYQNPGLLTTTLPWLRLGSWCSSGSQTTCWTCKAGLHDGLKGLVYMYCIIPPSKIRSKNINHLSVEICMYWCMCGRNAYSYAHKSPWPCPHALPSPLSISRWSVKMLLPMFAALPLLVAYSGGTGIAVPKPLQALLGLQGSFLELGILYQVWWGLSKFGQGYWGCK